MRVLILVSSSTEHPYEKFLEAQEATWDSADHPNVGTVFFTAGTEKEWIQPRLLQVECPTGYFWQHWKIKQTLDAVWIFSWDYVFLTHSASYIDKGMLYDIAKGMPRYNVYAGQVLGEGLPETTWEGKIVHQRMVSGAGTLLSRDVADILRKNTPNNENIEADVLAGRILQTNGVCISDDIPGVQINAIEDYKDCYHYRFKTTDRMRDIENMKAVHQLKMKKYNQ